MHTAHRTAKYDFCCCCCCCCSSSSSYYVQCISASGTVYCCCRNNNNIGVTLNRCCMYLLVALVPTSCYFFVGGGMVLLLRSASRTLEDAVDDEVGLWIYHFIFIIFIFIFITKQYFDLNITCRYHPTIHSTPIRPYTHTHTHINIQSTCFGVYLLSRHGIFWCASYHVMLLRIISLCFILPSSIE